MMREIKFRGWERELQMMVYDTELGGWHFEYDGNPVRAVNQMINEEDYFYNLMQYTGLKDRNGKEIYEGDIIRITNNFQENEIDYNAQIIFKDGGFCAIDGTENNYGIRRYRLSDFGYELKVIGNIHQHPELLGDNQ